MRKSEMFDRILDRVCEECEVSKENVLTGVRLQAVVDARMMVVQFLRLIGLSNDDIALVVLRKLAGDPGFMPTMDEIRRKAKGVNKMYNAYDSRKRESYSFSLMAQAVNEYCRKEYGLYYDEDLGMKRLPEK